MEGTLKWVQNTCCYLKGPAGEKRSTIPHAASIETHFQHIYIHTLLLNSVLSVLAIFKHTLRIFRLLALKLKCKFCSCLPVYEKKSVKMSSESTKWKPENDHKDNIYMNIYPATRTFGWRIKYVLLRWKGSVFKCMWQDTLIYVCLYFMISIMYRLIVAGGYTTAKHNFELLCVHCNFYDQPTPVAILTGFYVSNVVNRWWTQFMSVPWPDQLALKLVAFIPSKVSTIAFTKLSMGNQLEKFLFSNQYIKNFNFALHMNEKNFSFCSGKKAKQ